MFQALRQRLIASLLAAAIASALTACAPNPRSSEYKEMYSYLETPIPKRQLEENSDYFLVVLVDARHLDYTNNLSFFRTVAKHPDDWSKQGDVGHVWIYLKGMEDGEPIYLEGGYSGESGLYQARYFDGMMNCMDYGFANPTNEQMKNPSFEPNPAKYLWDIQHDGFFQWGSGCHRPTFAAKVSITKEQFWHIWSFIDNFAYCNYSIINSQCSSFAAQIAALAGLDLECEVNIPIEPELKIKGRTLRFWQDPAYSLLTVSSPDVIEKSLIEAVIQGKAEYALDWYLNSYPEPWEGKIKTWKKTAFRFPKRLFRYLLIAS